MDTMLAAGDVTEGRAGQRPAPRRRAGKVETAGREPAVSAGRIIRPPQFGSLPEKRETGRYQNRRGSSGGLWSILFSAGEAEPRGRAFPGRAWERVARTP